MKARRRALWAALIVVVVLLGVAVYPFVVGDMEKLTLDDAARAGMPDQSFVRLSDGVVHYEWAGPAEGRKVVLVHGFTSPSFIWDHQFAALADAGFRVLRYDLYGRGLSDRPFVRYDRDLFDRQLVELLDSQHLDAPVELVGLSMGGAIVVNFMDRHPERVERYALFAPAGFPLHVPLKYRVIKLPWVGEWISKAFGDRVIRSGLTRHMTIDPVTAAEFEGKYVEQMKYKGYKRALLSTLRSNPLMDLSEVYARVGKSGRPGLLFWGNQDHVVSFEHHLLVQKAIPNIEFHALEGMGHTANYEVPEQVNPVLISFLGRPEGAA
jgi:pimeloyl-ACP methyl ester carboxylesterase